MKNAGEKRAASSKAQATLEKKGPSGKGTAIREAAANLAAAPDKKGAASKSASASTKAAASKDGAAKAVAGKAGAKGSAKVPPPPPPPPRKIQVVQLTTLKPGARGTKASVARAAGASDDRNGTTLAKKRRSASLNAQQLDHFRQLLEQRRTRLSSDLSLMQDEALKVTTQDNSSDSVADNGTDNYEQDFTLGLIESEEALAREVDEALVRIDKGTFGICEGCGTPIPLARLEIVPFTRNCVDCQQKREGLRSS